MRRWHIPTTLIGCLLGSYAVAFDFSPQPRIIGGGFQSIDDVPWQVFIESTNGVDTYICGGVIISDNYILTAAHCMDKDVNDNNGVVTPYLPSEVTVYAGVEDRAALAGNGISVNTISIHEDYTDSNFEYDVALIRLGGPLPLNTQAVTLLAPESESRFENEIALETPDNLFVSGWGRTSNTSELTSRFLKSTILTGESDSQCTRIGSPINNTHYLCAKSSESTGSCGGDSGGGLIWRDPNHQSDSDLGYRVVGVVSWGSAVCGIPQDEDVFAQLTSYYSWITTTMGGYLPPSSTFTVDIFNASDSSDSTPSPSPSTPIASGNGGGGGSLGWLSLIPLGLLAFRRRLS